MNGYILTGGRSRRMGASKTTLFLERIVAVARSVFDEVMAVQRSGEEPLDIPTIFEEPHDGDGAVFGIITALRHTLAGETPSDGILAAGPSATSRSELSRCFILAVDYPLVTSEVLTYLRDREGLPVWNGRPQPLCAVWRTELLPRLEKRVAAGMLDLHTLAGEDMISEPELRARFAGEPLMNVNTPAEMKEAGRLYGQGFLAPR